MSNLFELTTIKNMVLANRLVRSATWEGLAGEDGSCTPAIVDVAVQLARGGVGLIITGHTFVREDGRAGIRQMAIYDDLFLPGLIEMTSAVHEAGGKIVMQISHAGCRAAAHLSGLQPMGPSRFENERGVTCREITRADIEAVTDSFAQASVRAQKAGFDGVQIHGAHGYLLDQFLSPFYNKRADSYGGPVENRTRVVLEVLKRIRNGVGEDFPVLIKMTSEDFLDGGLTVGEMLEASRMLEQAGIDAIEMSGMGMSILVTIRRSAEDGQDLKSRKFTTAKRREASKIRCGCPSCWWAASAPTGWPNSLSRRV